MSEPLTYGGLCSTQIARTIAGSAQSALYVCSPKSSIGLNLHRPRRRGEQMASACCSNDLTRGSPRISRDMGRGKIWNLSDR
jgi:hypothetical protein